MSRLMLAVLLFASAAVAADVTGTWQMTVETSQGSGTPTVDLKQQGEQLTGTFHSQIFGEVAVKGTVKGDQIEFGFEGDAGGTKLKVTYKGAIQSPTAMKGTAVYEGFDDKATWTATKK
jgi:hypothetical protein